MKKLIIDSSCTICGHSETHEQITCDTCGNILSAGLIIREMDNKFPLKLFFSDLREYDFCDYHCLMRFLVEEWKKEPHKQGDKNEI